MLNSLQVAVCPPVWSGFLSAELGGQINPFLKRAHKFGFSNKIHTVEEIAKEADETLFLKMKCKQHCLNPTLAIHKPNTHGLRPTEHSYELPECRLQLGKSSCIICCLYRYRWWYGIALFYCFYVSFSAWLYFTVLCMYISVTCFK